MMVAMGSEPGPAPEYLVQREPVRRVVLADPDPRWAELYEREAERLRDGLGTAVVSLDHVGSTSVPGLAAKPVIDVLLLVRDSRQEDAYVPALQRAGYTFVLREPHWYEHRLLKLGLPHFGTTEAVEAGTTKVNLHVFTAGAEEAHRMLAFRDRLRADRLDRELYQETKRELAAREWDTVQQYADAKSAVVRRILDRSDP